MIVVGLVFGRWWKWTIPLGAVAWAILVALTVEAPDVVGALLFGAANTAVGVGLFMLGRAAFHTFRHAQQ
jgi:hypothetical protein